MDEQALIEQDILGYLEQHQNKELLRFTTVGSVDDGKSTLIGRLLYDAHGLYEDQLRAVERASTQKSGAIDLSLVTDGLRAEREQGITIDVAYRYFSTQRRKFIIADTPGHVQYTRNMATGASTANVAVILIDARLGVLPQSRRHAYIASLLGIPHLFVCVNKMDLREYDLAAYESIRVAFSEFASHLGFRDVTFIPVSAKLGDNVVHPSERMAWYQGKTLLEHLETVPIATDRNLEDFRYPVQYVLRPHLDYRGFSGEIASGIVRKGDPILILPSRKTSRVRAIDTYGGELANASSPLGVTIRLEDEVDVSRGDMFVHPDNVPTVAQRFEAMLVWMYERPLDLEKSYYLKHTTAMVRADVEAVLGQRDLETLDEVPSEGLVLNDIGRVRVRTHRPLFFDAYKKNRSTGAFILIDSITNNTVAAGMIVGPVTTRARDGDSAGARTQVSPLERRERLGQAGAVVWVTSTSSEQSAEIAYAAERRLFDMGRVACVVDPTEPGVDGRALDEVVIQAARGGFIVVTWSPEGDDGKSREAAFAARGVGEFVRVVSSVEPPAAAPSVVAVSTDSGSAAAEGAADSVVAALRERGVFGS
jgi:bifunctional enzyme CysN/CysC